MDNLVIEKIQNYIPKKVFHLRATCGVPHGIYDHVFSNILILAEKLSKLFIDESKFHVKGVDVGFNGPIEFTDKQEFVNYVANGYNSGWYSLEYKGQKLNVDIFCIEIDSDLRI